MSLDPVTSAALSADVIRPVFFGLIDFQAVPTRVNTSGGDVAFTGTGDIDLDGFTFLGLRADVVDIGAVANKGGGTEGVDIVISGLQGLDDAMLAEIADPTHWRGREIRLWRMIRNAANVQQGAVQHYYTGNMTSLSLSATPESQQIEVRVESYLASYSEASNSTYLDQEEFDAGDKSAWATIDIANNPSGGANTSSGAGGGAGGGGGGGNNRAARLLQQ